MRLRLLSVLFLVSFAGCTPVAADESAPVYVSPPIAVITSTDPSVQANVRQGLDTVTESCFRSAVVTTPTADSRSHTNDFTRCMEEASTSYSVMRPDHANCTPYADVANMMVCVVPPMTIPLESTTGQRVSFVTSPTAFMASPATDEVAQAAMQRLHDIAAACAVNVMTEHPNAPNPEKLAYLNQCIRDHTGGSVVTMNSEGDMTCQPYNDMPGQSLCLYPLRVFSATPNAAPPQNAPRATPVRSPPIRGVSVTRNTIDGAQSPLG